MYACQPAIQDTVTTHRGNAHVETTTPRQSVDSVTLRKAPMGLIGVPSRAIHCWRRVQAML